MYIPVSTWSSTDFEGFGHGVWAGLEKNANNGAANGADEEREGRSRSECHGSTQHEV